LVIREGNGRQIVEISGRNGSVGEKESMQTKENLERYNKME